MLDYTIYAIPMGTCSPMIPIRRNRKLVILVRMDDEVVLAILRNDYNANANPWVS